MALQIDWISDLLQNLNHGQQQLAAGDASVRMCMLQWAWNLAHALENPYGGIMRMLMVDTTTKALVQLATTVDLFAHLGEDQGQAVTGYELAKKTGVEDSLLTRILQHLAVSDVVREAGPDRYFASPMSKALVQETTQDILKFYNTAFVPALGFVPEFFAKNGYREPHGGTKTPIQMAFNTDLHIFEYVKSDPELARLFKAAVLSREVRRRAYWDTPDFYPVQERLLHGLHREDDCVLMVDMAGGVGLDRHVSDKVAGFHKAFPDPADGRLILQETEQVLSTVGDLPSRIEKMSNDFFQTQPVKGARAYYLHHIFHDWSDENCWEMLLALQLALAPGYSKVLIQDHVFPLEGASWFNTTSDVMMMVAFAGKERTQTGFEALFESVGMKVTGVWTRAPNEESVVEAVLLD